MITTASDVFFDHVMFLLCVDVHRVSTQADAIVHGTLEWGHIVILTNQVAGIPHNVGQVTETLKY